MEESPMTAAPRHPRQAKAGRGQQAKPDKPPPKKAGRPKGAPSTIVNLRIPLALLAQLDRYIDQLEVQTGLKANRGMIARRALALFLETRSTGKRKRSL
jgi:hypothetical protein